MPKIMVSYRRADTQGTAGRIFDRLTASYGRASVFFDIDSVPFGTDFRQDIRLALNGCDALLAIIGRKWVGPGKRGQNRISRDDDHVRFEIETALANKLLVIPVLVDGAAMPRKDQLPESLQDFPYLNAVVVDSGRDFHVHMDRLIDGINRQLEQAKNLKPKEPDPLADHADYSELSSTAEESGHAGPAPIKPPAGLDSTATARTAAAPELSESVGGQKGRPIGMAIAVTAALLLVATSSIFFLRDKQVVNLPGKAAPAAGPTSTSNTVAEPVKTPSESKALHDCTSVGGGADQVIASCRTAIESEKLPGNLLADALAARGRAEFGKGQRDFAIQDYDQAIKIRPNDAQVYKDRGIALAANRQFDRAIADFDQALKLNPADTDALAYRRSARPEMSPPSKAFRDCTSGANADQVIADCTTVIQIEKLTGDPLADALAARGRAQASKGQRDFAIRDYDQAIKINPNKPQIYKDRGLALAANRQFDRAIADFDQVLKLNPADADARTYRNASNADRLKGK